ncbi:MAG: DUF2185 domain-containing protein [Gammaproteobacteria bacterium]|nr:DUF2185 domain-containing protein [Gammaproteobacteria bacterium]
MQEEQETLWYLEDARELAEVAPYTFYLPSTEVVAMLKPGDAVMLMFRSDEEAADEEQAERLWVRITVVDDVDFRGELEDEPALIADLTVGDEIDFAVEHIIDTQLDDPVPNIVEQYTANCFVTKRVFDDEHPVGALYRENPDETEDELEDFSGWNIMAGDEDEDYLDNPDNWHYVSLGSVLDIDDRFIDVLDAPYDSEFEYDEEHGTFVEVEDGD